MRDRRTGVRGGVQVSWLSHNLFSGGGSWGLHPVRNPRFGSFRIQTLENLSAAVKLPIKNKFLGIAQS